MSDRKPHASGAARKRARESHRDRATRMSIFRTPRHIYAQVIDATRKSSAGECVQLEPEVRSGITHGGNIAAATLIGKRIAESTRRGRGDSSLRPIRVPLPRSGQALADAIEKAD